MKLGLVTSLPKLPMPMWFAPHPANDNASRCAAAGCETYRGSHRCRWCGRRAS